MLLSVLGNAYITKIFGQTFVVLPLQLSVLPISVLRCTRWTLLIALWLKIGLLVFSL